MKTIGYLLFLFLVMVGGAGAIVLLLYCVQAIGQGRIRIGW
jgi:hypothetical protein